MKLISEHILKYKTNRMLLGNPLKVLRIHPDDITKLHKEVVIDPNLMNGVGDCYFSGIALIGDSYVIPYFFDDDTTT